MSKQSIEDLKIIQGSHEEELARKQAEKEALARKQEEEEQALAEQKKGAKLGLVRHAELLEELRQLDEDARRAEVLRIEERAHEADELTKTREERRIALHALQLETSNAVAYFQEVEDLVKEKKEDEIHPDVLAAYKEAKATKDGLENAVANLIAEIEKMGVGMVTEEEIEQYKALQKRVDELNKELGELIENPHVLEGLVEQGKDEETIKSALVREVVRDHQAFGPERQKFLEDITRSFLEEELRAKGIAGIADLDERQKAIRTFVADMARGYNSESITVLRNDKQEQTKARCAGVALKAILNPHLRGDFVLSYLRAAADGTDPHKNWDKNNKDFQDRMKTGVETHMGTLNLLLSYEQGVKANQKRVLGVERLGKRPLWTDMSQSLYEMGMGYGIEKKGGAFLPSQNEEGYKEGDRELILRTFERDVARAERMDQRILEGDISSMEREVAELAEQARALKETRDTLLPAEETIKKFNSSYQMGYNADSSGYISSEDVVRNTASRRCIENAIKKEEQRILDAENAITQLETEFSGLGLLSWRRKKEIREEIIRLQGALSSVEELEKKKADLEKWDTAAEIIQKEREPSWALTRSLTGIETKLLQKQQQLSTLQQKLLQKSGALLSTF